MAGLGRRRLTHQAPKKPDTSGTPERSTAVESVRSAIAALTPVDASAMTSKIADLVCSLILQTHKTHGGHALASERWNSLAACVEEVCAAARRIVHKQRYLDVQSVRALGGLLNRALRGLARRPP